ncbi:proline-rich antigen, Pra [Mycobacterium lentiflavum]|uniref:Proline-rich antigen, Pra n=1 Tax=Mycobacterium lentiflavum TaxID=141349 RepID=A0A0E4H043_MYCLN|nr:RDD family protein [Mycobacterium lentiflavum]CQD19854.1 proline-rich antigen, Pra [Mycobacterium lentiflavum]
MTDQPPPSSPPEPAGGYEPASGGYEPASAASDGNKRRPPSGAGYAPPPPGPAVRALPPDSYTPWLTRVLALLIDYLPYAIVQGIGTGIMYATQQSSCVTDITQYDVSQYCVSQPSTIGQLAQWLATLAGLAYWLWNRGYRQGTTGSSLGKTVMKIKVVSETTGAPIGFGMSVVRDLAHFVDAVICFIGFLFPLWDAKRQTIADKILTTVVLPI